MNTFALIVFFAIAAIGYLIVVQTFVKPFALFGFFKTAFGFDFTETANKDAATTTGFKKLMSFLVSGLFGSNTMTIFLAWMAFHDSVALAWWVLWYWPIMFCWHFTIYKKGIAISYIQLGWLVLSVAALILTSSIAFP